MHVFADPLTSFLYLKRKEIQPPIGIERNEIEPDIHTNDLYLFFYLCTKLLVRLIGLMIISEMRWG